MGGDGGQLEGGDHRGPAVQMEVSLEASEGEACKATTPGGAPGAYPCGRQRCPRQGRRSEQRQAAQAAGAAAAAIRAAAPTSATTARAAGQGAAGKQETSDRGCPAGTDAEVCFVVESAALSRRSFGIGAAMALFSLPPPSLAARMSQLLVGGDDEGLGAVPLQAGLPRGRAVGRVNNRKLGARAHVS